MSDPCLFSSHLFLIPCSQIAFSLWIGLEGSNSSDPGNHAHLVWPEPRLISDAPNNYAWMIFVSLDHAAGS